MTTTAVTAPARYRINPDNPWWGLRATTRNILTAHEPLIGVRNTMGRVSLIVPRRDLNAGSAAVLGPVGGASAEHVRGLGLDPDDYRVHRVDVSAVTFVPEDPRAGLPMFSVTDRYQLFTRDQVERLAAFEFYGSPYTNPAEFTTLIVSEDEKNEHDLTWFYDMDSRVRERTGLTGEWYQFNMPNRALTESTPGTPKPETIVVTASTLKKMSKKDLRKAVKAAQAAHQQDIAKINARLEQEATSRDWCEVYDDVVSDLSAGLTVPLKPRRHLVRRRYAFTVHHPAHANLLVPEDDATEEEIAAAALEYAVRTYGVGTTVSDVTA